MASKSKSRVSRNISSDAITPVGGKRSVVRAAVAIVKDDEKPTLAYKVLSASKTKQFLEADNISELERLVTEHLELKDPRLDLKASSQIDFYVGAVWWCKQQSFNADQTSAFYTVIDGLLKNIDGKEMNLADNILHLKKLLVGVGLGDQFYGDTTPEWGGMQGLFDVIQAKNLVAYITTSLFQHHKLYEFMFHNHQSEHVIGTNLQLETAPDASNPWPPPLCEAIPLSEYQEHFEVKTASEEMQGADHIIEEDEELANAEPLSEVQEQQEAELLSKLTPEQVEQVIEEVCTEMLGNLEVEVAAKLRKRENDLISRINRLNVVLKT